jgi:hypothetical protein
MFQWTAPAAGTGTVTFYGAFAITTSATKLSTLVVNELVTVPLTVQATATPQVITVGDSTYLQAAADGGSGSYTYSWTSVPAGFSSGQQNVWAKPAVSTRYIVQVNDGIITALDSVDVTVNFPSGIVLNNGTSGFVLFPNPNHGTFKLVTERNEPVTVSVFDLSGRMAWRENFLPLSAGSALTIDISSLPKGIYFVEAVSGSRKSIQKMIIY